MICNTFNLKEPLSFEHWMNSLGTVTLIYGGYKGYQSNYTTSHTIYVSSGTSYFDDAVNSIKGWLGDDTYLVINKSGDAVFYHKTVYVE